MIETINHGVSEKVRHLRSLAIIGDCIDMIPYTSEYDSEVVRLRSIHEARYYMNLSKAPCENDQITWREGYESRSDDVMWIIRNKSGVVCGTNRIYDISKDFCEKGSLIVDPVHARTAPITLESELIVIKTAFDEFDVRGVITHVRPDNLKMNSINDRFGFVRDGEVDIRGENYHRYILSRKSWNPEPFQAILSQWAKRFI